MHPDHFVLRPEYNLPAAQVEPEPEVVNQTDMILLQLNREQIRRNLLRDANRTGSRIAGVATSHGLHLNLHYGCTNVTMFIEAFVKGLLDGLADEEGN